MKYCKDSSCSLYDCRLEIPYFKQKNNSILIIGDSPTKLDLMQKRPFTGVSLELLETAFFEAGLAFEDAFLAYAVRCRFDKKVLSIKQINDILNCCKKKLDKLIEFLQPRVILICGDLPLKQFIKKPGGVDKNRSTFTTLPSGIPAFVTYSPVFCNTNKSYVVEFKQDIKTLARFVKNNYQPIKLEPKVEQIADLSVVLPSDLKSIAIDTETQGLDWLDPNSLLLSFSVCFDEKVAYQVSLNEWAETVSDAESWIEVSSKEYRQVIQRSIPIKKSINYFKNLKILAAILKSGSVRKYMFNGQFDLCFIAQEYKKAFNAELEVNNFAIDVQALAHLLDENVFSRASLESVRKSYTTFDHDYSINFDASFDKGNMVLIDKEQMGYYAALDAYTTFVTANAAKRRLLFSEKKSLQNYFVKFVMPTLTYGLPTLTMNGGYIDKASIPKVKHELAVKIKAIHDDVITRLIPYKIRQLHAEKGLKLSRIALLRDALYHADGYNLDTDEVTKGGSMPSFSAQTRVYLKSAELPPKARELIELYEEWSSLNVLLTRYIKAFETSIRSDGRIHPTYAIVTTSTGRTCLAKGTLVYVSDAREKVPIEDIKVGDRVWSFKESSIELVSTKVAWSGLTYKNKNLVKVTYKKQDNGSVAFIDCTPDHLFLLDNGSYKQARDLIYGDRLVSLERLENIDPMVVSVSDCDYTLDVYDLTIDGPPNFIANGVCVHNSTSQPSFQNLPKLNENSKIIRKLIVPEAGNVLLAIDYSQCLVPETLIKTDQGIKPLAEVIGHNYKVLSVNKQFCFEYKDVLNGWCTGENEVFNIVLQSGGNVVATANHKFYDACFQARTIADLGVDAYVINTNSLNSYVVDRIVSITPLGRRLTYQIEVADNHNYVLANGLVSKNCELRWMAHLSQDETLKQVYKDDGDIHTKTALALLGKTIDTVSSDELKAARKSAKCFHPDTEVLTKDGWVSFRNLKPETEVMQAVKNGTSINLEWSKPLYFKLEPNHTDSLVSIQSENINIKVTPDHQMLVQRKNGKFDKVSIDSFVKARSFWNAGYNRSFASSIAEERIIRLAVATQADGSYFSRDIRFGLYKTRKIERLLSLLEDGEYNITKHKNDKNRPVTAITLKGPIVDKIKSLLSSDKTFNWNMLGWSLSDRLTVINELKYWEGFYHKPGKFITYSSTIKTNCDIIQALCAISGWKTKLQVEVSDKYSTGCIYRVHLKNSPKSRGLSCDKLVSYKVESEPYTGDVAVISMPSDIILVRSHEGDGGQIPIICHQCLNFGLLYGMSVAGFQRYAKVKYSIDLSYEEAENLVDIFFSTYPGIRSYHKKVIAFARKFKYVQSPFGRIRRLPGIASFDKKEIARCERQALNHAIQSAASDTALVALNQLISKKVLNKKEANPIIFIHDELVFEINEKKLEYYYPLIKQEMENPPLKELFGVEFSIPLRVDAKIGFNFGDLEDYPAKGE